MIVDNSRRAGLAILFFWVLLGVKIGYTLLEYFDVPIGRWLQSYCEGNLSFTIPFAWLSTIISLPSTLIRICVVVSFLVWFRNVYHNLETTAYPGRFQSKWALWSWFIPIVCWYLPFMLMMEAWDKIQKNYTPHIQKKTWLFVWWPLFLLTSQATYVLWIAFVRIDISRWDVYLIRQGLDLLAGFITIFIIRKISSFERQLRHHLMVQHIGQTDLHNSDTKEEGY